MSAHGGAALTLRDSVLCMASFGPDASKQALADAVVQGLYKSWAQGSKGGLDGLPQLSFVLEHFALQGLCNPRPNVFNNV